MPMRNTVFAVAILALAACSPAATTAPDAGPDVAQIVGTWVGTSTITSGSQTGSVTSTVHIVQGALGLVTLDICPDLSPVNATVTSPTSFSLVVPFTCPAGAVTGCSSAALTYTSGGGSIGLAPGIPAGDGGTSDGGTSGGGGPLQFSAAGTLAGCQLSSPLSVTFAGTKQ